MGISTMEPSGHICGSPYMTKTSLRLRVMSMMLNISYEWGKIGPVHTVKHALLYLVLQRGLEIPGTGN